MSSHRWLPRGLVRRPGSGAVLGVVLGAVAGLAACEDQRPAPAPEAAAASMRHADRQAARALLTQLTAIASPPARTETLMHAIDVGALVALMVPPEVPFLPPSASLAAAGELSDCLLATSNAATLTECELGTHVVDGTWSLQYPAAHTELVDVFVVGPRDHGSLWIDARLTVAERVMDSLPDMPSVRSIDGDIEISLMWTADNREYALDASIHIDELAVDGDAGPSVGHGVGSPAEPAGNAALEPAEDLGPASVCALGGAITIRGSVSTGDQSRVTVWLGPGCRDVHVARSARS